jgi:hypothetical protein
MNVGLILYSSLGRYLLNGSGGNSCIIEIAVGGSTVVDHLGYMSNVT